MIIFLSRKNSINIKYNLTARPLRNEKDNFDYVSKYSLLRKSNDNISLAKLKFMFAYSLLS